MAAPLRLLDRSVKSRCAIRQELSNPLAEEIDVRMTLQLTNRARSIVQRSSYACSGSEVTKSCRNFDIQRGFKSHQVRASYILRGQHEPSQRRK